MVADKSIVVAEYLHEMGFESVESFAIEMLRKQLQDEIKRSSSEIEKFEKKYGMDYSEFVSRFDSLNQWTLFEKEDDSMDWKAETKLIRIYEKRLAVLV
jgi:hypothetical protein